MRYLEKQERVWRRQETQIRFTDGDRWTDAVFSLMKLSFMTFIFTVSSSATNRHTESSHMDEIKKIKKVQQVVFTFLQASSACSGVEQLS